MTMTVGTSWAKIIRRYVYGLIILIVMLGLIAAGYISWHKSSSDEIQRLANDYHLASTSHYLKAMEELRHMMSHLSYDLVKANIDIELPITVIHPKHGHSISVSFHLIQQEIRNGLELQRTFADGRFDSLSTKLEQQLTKFRELGGDYFLKGTAPNQLIHTIRGLLTSFGQLVRLHTIVRTDLLIDMKAREGRQEFIFFVLVSALLLAGFLILKRGLRAIDVVIARQQESEHELKDDNLRMSLAAY